MKIEYEATFKNIDKDNLRAKLLDLGASLKKKEFLQKRATFNLPKGQEVPGAWVRVRDEVDRVTLTYKVVDGRKIENQKEIEMVVDSYAEAEKFVEVLGCEKKAYQETKREIWEMDRVEIMIDEWPFLEPIVEIEGESEDVVKTVAEKLGFDYNDAIFGSIDFLYSEKYGISLDRINNQTPLINFDMDNPFLA